ncbi:unnamed protein product [Adineta ricciae]|uniref:Uncharacterized protein n=1 Tax=Adineta ricciae TaxID=249248 RepID=A0A814EWN7_ADIRI|nr:unnamed protein product [Adineta ricciae]CAF0974973.1 unnamed protein product [Adineta ricciae]
MTSSKTTKRVCVTCQKGGDVFMCRGCQRIFCPVHVDEHREKVAKDVEKLAEEHELLQRDMNRDHEVQLLSSMIDTWEQESIEKIHRTATTARSDLQRWLERNNTEVKVPFAQITSEVRACQKSENYTEIDLKRWIQQLEEYRNKVEKAPVIDMLDEEDSIYIHLIKLRENTNDLAHNHFLNGSTLTLNQSMLSFQDTTLLVRERFDEIYGPAEIFEDGLVAAYAGAWLGYSSVCGINNYSSGTHHIRFRILEKFYDSPFFGIVSALQTNMEHSLETVSTHGWWNFDCSIIRGEKEQRTERDKIIRISDELTLTIDCERTQIFLKHHRSRRLLHIPVDVRSCPLPWKLLVVLHRRGDSVRIIGGTLNLTRENLSSRLSHKRKP